MPSRSAVTAATENRNYSDEAFEVLDYNQQLVQFADNKAGTLIVINSLFIAAVQALHSQNSLVALLGTLSVLAAAMAIYFCFGVVSTRFVPLEGGRDDLIFFGDILKRSTPEQYTADFMTQPGVQWVEDILRRSYVVAAIAQRKYAAYGTAQMATGLSGFLWVVANISSMVLP